MKKKQLNAISPAWNMIFVMILIVPVLLVLIPMALMFIISFSSESSIMRNGYRFLPEEWSLQGYVYLVEMGDQLVSSYAVTIAYSVVGTLLGVILMAMFAYVIIQKNFRLCRALTWFMFFTMLFSGGLVPMYIMCVRYYKLKDTFWILLLPSLVSAYNIIILRTFMKTTIPEALFDAARIDGAGHFTIFLQIVLPLSKAGLATVALFSFITKWNDWFVGMMYIENPKLVPLQTLLTKLQKSIDFLKQNARVASSPDTLEMMRKLPSASLRMACAVVAIIPILFAYPFFQRYFVSGLTVGGIKE